MDTKHLRDLVMKSNDGNLCAPAMSAADTIDRLNDEIDNLRARLEKTEAARERPIGGMISDIGDLVAKARNDALEEAAKAADAKENYWNTVAYHKRQNGRNDNFACASANASCHLATDIRALKST